MWSVLVGNKRNMITDIVHVDMNIFLMRGSLDYLTS